MSESSIHVENLGVFYRRWSGFFSKKKYWALTDVSFDVKHGETLGILGRNGAGKSTLLNVLSGIISPDRGSVDLFGGTASLLSLQAGFVSELSGRDNAALGGLLLGVPMEEVQARLEEVIAFSELNDFIDQPIGTYSSGMKARLGFSVAFHANPEVILLDEVLGVGDAAFRKKSSEAMVQLLGSQKTVVLVSHSTETLLELCDRVMWLDQGKSRMLGNPADVIAEYEKTIK